MSVEEFHDIPYKNRDNIQELQTKIDVLEKALKAMQSKIDRLDYRTASLQMINAHQ